MKRDSFQRMKSENRTRVLQVIRRHDGISRADIAKQTGLTPPTVTNLVQELLQEELVEESRAGDSKGGRKPILLTVHPHSRRIIGVDVGVKKVRTAAADMHGRLLKQQVSELPPSLSEEQFMAFLKETIEHFLAASPEVRTKVIGVGVAMHGIVNAENGEAVHAPSFGFRRMPVRKRLEEALAMPVFIENDAKAMALGEHWFGAGRTAESFFCLNLGEGIGGGFIYQGELYHGADHLAGEAGHVVIAKDGPVCSCGGRGCLQAFVSGGAVRRQLHLEGAEAADAEGLYESARDGSAASIRRWEEIGDTLGIGLVNVIHLLNPPLVLLGGGMAGASDYFLPALRSRLERQLLSGPAVNISVQPGALGRDASLIGACTLVIADLFTV
ncbi:ROK family transcriptional regulator [Alkalicoccus chagannorensis]|uniref:ROK family transcriptional regulator n=1 Tax=Alkalicoccus chagannorensis TaxID=427072 RepID=UPI0004215CCB|nr:ROK family transcriptional regulator [Alkalicoccus chagannorensis]